MIVRVSFTGITKKDNKKSTLEDYVDIHANDLKDAKEIFSSWTKTSGIRGASGIFHPLNGYGDIRIKTVTEVTKTNHGVLEEIEEENDHEQEEPAKPKVRAEDLEAKRTRPTGSRRSTQPKEVEAEK